MRTEEILALQSAVRSVGADRIEALATTPDSARTVPKGALRALGEMGLLTPRGVEDGGEGMPNHLEWTFVAEELAKVDAGTALDVIASAFAAVLVSRGGTSAQRAGLLSGGSDARRGTVLYYEGFGRSPDELTATGDGAGGGFRISGRKIGVVRAGESAYGVVIVRRGDELHAAALPHETLRGLTTVRDDAVGGQLGARAATMSTVELDEVDADPLTEADELTVHRCVAGYRLAVASSAIGTGAAAVRYAADYATSREAFGHPIAEYQGVAFPLVDATIALDAARLAVQDLATDLDELSHPAEIVTRTGAAVSAASRAATGAAVVGVNTLGGHGYLTDHPVERWYRDAAVLAALDFDPLSSDWSSTH